MVEQFEQGALRATIAAILQYIEITERGPIHDHCAALWPERIVPRKVALRDKLLVQHQLQVENAQTRKETKMSMSCGWLI